jgi:hypothetical protein
VGRAGVERLFEDDFEGATDGVLGADGFTFGAPITFNVTHHDEHLLTHHQAALITNGDAEAAAVTEFQIDDWFLGQIMSSVLKPKPALWRGL